MEDVRVCEVANEQEAAMVVGVLQEEGLAARSDATPAAPAFGGLPFESGHGVYVPASQVEKARKILSKYPHFQKPKHDERG